MVTILSPPIMLRKWVSQHIYCPAKRHKIEMTRLLISNQPRRHSPIVNPCLKIETWGTRTRFCELFQTWATRLLLGRG